MSYKKYIEFKENNKVEVCLDKYRQNMEDVVTKMVSSGCRAADIMCQEEIVEFLKEDLYPQSELTRIFLYSKNKDKINNQILKIKEWYKSKGEKGKTLYLINLLESGLYSSPGVSDIKMCLESYERYYKNKLNLLASKIESCLKNINWRNYESKLEAIPIKDGLKVEEAQFCVAGEPKLTFNLEYFNIRSHSSEEKYLKLVEAFKQKEPCKISTFYLNDSFGGDLGSMKKEMSLGIKQYLLEGTKLYREPRGEKNIWKVKLDESKLLRLEDEYIVGCEDALIRSLEKQK
jgi:hypothetical protein